jgi:hypothetical protein
MIIVAGLLLAIVAVLLVLEPVLRAAAGKPVEMAVPLFVDSDDDDDPLQRRRDRALAALREIEFDRATGKLSDDDFHRMTATYQAEALEALRAVDAAAGASSDGPRGSPLAARTRPRDPGESSRPADDDAVEALIAETRAAARERKQRFCAECGTPLEGTGKFCVECGVAVGV